jgi:adenosylcobinamide-phosphate synthase
MFGRMFGLVAESPVDPVVILFLGLALDAVAGDMRPLFRYVPHPVVAIGSLIAFLDERLNRETRSDATRAARGALVVIFVAALVLVVAWGVLSVTRSFTWGWLVELFLVAALLAQRSLYGHVAGVARALDDGGVPAGREAVSHIVGRDPKTLDEHGVARAAIESLFENFADGVVAPAFWYVVAGLPGLFLYKAVNTLDSMIGHLNPRYRAFGAAAARLDTAMNFLPARIAGLIVGVAAAFAPDGRPVAAFRVMIRDARKHRSVNAGWPEGAAAGGLGLALAGPRHYGGLQVNDPWIGDGRARATAGDIRRGLFLFAVACLLHAGLIGSLAMAREAAGL